MTPASPTVSGSFEDRFELGCNYWPRGSAMYMWRGLDLGEVRADFAHLRELGVRPGATPTTQPRRPIFVASTTSGWPGDVHLRAPSRAGSAVDRDGEPPKRLV